MEAGLSPGYLRTLLTRLRSGKPHGASHDTMQRLAAAARVPLAWLEDGVGAMEGGDAPAPVPVLPPVPIARGEPPADLADAVVLAFDASRHDPADVRALLDMLRDGRAMHRPQDPVATMRALLDGIHGARMDGAPLSWLELALRAHPAGRKAVEARSDELNGDGDAELAALKHRKS